MTDRAHWGGLFDIYGRMFAGFLPWTMQREQQIVSSSKPFGARGIHYSLVDRLSSVIHNHAMPGSPKYAAPFIQTKWCLRVSRKEIWKHVHLIYAEETEVLRDVPSWRLVPLTLIPAALAIIHRLTNSTTSFLCMTTDNTGRQDGEAKAHQQGRGDVCSPLCGASLLGV